MPLKWVTSISRPHQRNEIDPGKSRKAVINLGANSDFSTSHPARSTIETEECEASSRKEFCPAVEERSSLRLQHQPANFSQRLTQSLLVEYYFANVVPIFTIFDSPDDPFGRALHPYLSMDTPLLKTLAAIAALHLSNSRDDLNVLHQAFILRSQTIADVRINLRSTQVNAGTLITCLLLAATEVCV